VQHLEHAGDMKNNLLNLWITHHHYSRMSYEHHSSSLWKYLFGLEAIALMT
jgi:hypothetical protein